MPDIIDKAREIQEMYKTLIHLRKLGEINPKKWGAKVTEQEKEIMLFLQEYDNASAFCFALDQIALFGMELSSNSLKSAENLSKLLR